MFATCPPPLLAFHPSHTLLKPPAVTHFHHSSNSSVQSSPRFAVSVCYSSHWYFLPSPPSPPLPFPSSPGQSLFFPKFLTLFPFPLLTMNSDSDLSDNEGAFYDPHDEPIFIDSSSATPSRESTPSVVPESPLPPLQDIVPLPSSPSRPSSAPTAGSGTSRPSTSDLRTNYLPPIDEAPSSSTARPSMPPPPVRNWRTYPSVDPDLPFDPLELDVLKLYGPSVPNKPFDRLLTYYPPSRRV